jgi:hypothetical protein
MMDDWNDVTIATAKAFFLSRIIVTAWRLKDDKRDSFSTVRGLCQDFKGQIQEPRNLCVCLYRSQVIHARHASRVTLRLHVGRLRSGARLALSVRDLARKKARCNRPNGDVSPLMTAVGPHG